MEELEQIKLALEARVNGLYVSVNQLQEDITKQIDDLKESEILKAIRALHVRLQAIEARLPEEEEQ